MSRPGVATAPVVLLVEDDKAIGRHLRQGLAGHGYDSTWCRTGAGALAHARQNPVDVLLLDLGLPDLDGVDLARQLRADYPDLLIIMLTARSDEIDVIAGLDAGADDYLVKPFSISVLLARLRAHLRRRPAPASEDMEPVQIGDITLDLSARRCLVNRTEIPLRPKEFELLAALAARPNAALSREELMAQVWDEHWFGSTKTLDVTMAALRGRLAAARPETPTASTPTITTLRGHGYRLDVPDR